MHPQPPKIRVNPKSDGYKNCITVWLGVAYDFQVNKFLLQAILKCMCSKFWESNTHPAIQIRVNMFLHIFSL